MAERKLFLVHRVFVRVCVCVCVVCNLACQRQHVAAIERRL